ncbi:methyl-accepting chemotaxis protein [Amphritea balenae]|uniref:Methyl-accepting chemotaxis protein n=1 Tax=Amphritea balenae TaxID=452629 RepID=A0A3P1SNS1_9GAMM|nr:methyl-accepting chemotaxis protein [Amphritea balenae]RRC98806.1 methyl-accepting chemotaxis protein [Amphritea balenae]GGK61864.1 hypothetical protein GCM10007941_09970 [Amphritea balenae]
MSSFWQMKTINDRHIWEFRNIRMPFKFAIAGALLVMGLVFMAVSYYQTIAIEEQAQKRAQNLNGFLLLVSNIQSNIAQARYHEKSFQVDKNMGQLTLFNETMAQVDSDIQQMKQYLRTQQDQALVEQFQTVVDSYQDTFYDASESAIAAGLTSDTGLSGELNKLMWASDAMIVWIKRDWLRSQFDTLQGSLAEYIASGGRTLTREKVAKQILVMTNQLQAINVDKFPQNRVAVLENMAEADVLFGQLAEAVDHSTSQYDQLQTIISELDPRIMQVTALADIYKQQNETIQADETLDMVTYFFISMGLMIVALAVALSIVKYMVIDPVTRLQATVDSVREGDVEARSHLESKDELGQLGAVLDSLLDEKEQALTIKEEENSKLNRSIIELIQNVFLISQRDLTVRVPVAEDVTGAIADSINQLASSIESVLHDVNAVSGRVNSASLQVRSQSETVLNYASREQEEIIETLQGLDSAIKAMELISKLAVLSNNASQKAIKTSETAMDSVSQTINSINKVRQTIHEAEKRIKRLGERSQEIGGIVSLINNISERTHLLSLNASMHAASAGEAGRGLMVVVDEVQRLAENSREATSEIESLVNNIQLETADTINVMNTVITDVVEGTRLAEEAGERMDETRVTTQTLVESVVRIAQNSARQARVAKDLRERAGKIDETTLATNKEMQQQAELSDELVNAAQDLQRSVSVFKLAQPAVS